MPDTKPKKNKHLSLEDRMEIQGSLDHGMTFKAIGRRLGKDQTTISKEVKKHMEAELDTTLGYKKQERREEDATGKPRNYRNGHTTKTVKTQLGEVSVNVPRDRNGEFDPKIIGKYSRNADGMEEKILGLYAAGMSQGVPDTRFHRTIILSSVRLDGTTVPLVFEGALNGVVVRVR